MRTSSGSRARDQWSCASWICARETQPPGPRTRSGCSAGRSPPRRCRRRPAGSPARGGRATRSSSRDASCGWSPTVACTSSWRAASATAARDVSRSVPTHTIHSTPAGPGPVQDRVRRRGLGRQVAVAVDPHLRPRSGGHGRSMRGKSESPFSSRLPAVSTRPQTAASGSRWSSGAPASPSRRQSSDAACGITGDGEQRDDPQRFETVAEHRGGRRGVACLVQRPRLAFLDVRVRVLDELPHRAEPAREVELVDALAQRRERGCGRRRPMDRLHACPG